jgi:hypothetical protein
MSKKAFKFHFPEPMGPSAFGQPAKTMNKGKGTNCQLLCDLTEANKNEKEDENMWHMETQRLAEREANNGTTTENINERILKAVNLCPQRQSKAHCTGTKRQ